eukprot:jgi/Picsp_1/6204/NSC_03558-R1_---NA---
MATEASLLALMRASQGPRSAKCEQRRIDIQQHLLSELRDCKSESRVVIDDIVGALLVKGQKVSKIATVKVMQDILDNRFILVDLSKMNKRQERSTMNAVAMGLLAYDDRGVVLLNGERHTCEKVLTSSLEKMRADFARHCPEVEGALQARLKRRCKISAKTAADHVRHMFEPLNRVRQSLSCNLPSITLRSLRDREDADAALFLPLLLIELLADLHFYRNATKADATQELMQMEEHMGYRTLIPLALQELEKQAHEALARESDPYQQDQGMAATSKGTRKRTLGMTSKRRTAPKRPKQAVSRVSARVVLAREDQGNQVALHHHLLQPSSPRECTPLGSDKQTLPSLFDGATCGADTLEASKSSVWVGYDVYDVLQYDADPRASEVMWYEQGALDEHLLGLLRGASYEEDEVPLISTTMPHQGHDFLCTESGVVGQQARFRDTFQEASPQSPSPSPQVYSGVVLGPGVDVHGSKLTPDQRACRPDYILDNDHHLDVLDIFQFTDTDMGEAVDLEG